MIQRTGLTGKSWATAGYDTYPSESELKKISRLNQFDRIIVRIIFCLSLLLWYAFVSVPALSSDLLSAVISKNKTEQNKVETRCNLNSSNFCW